MKQTKNLKSASNLSSKFTILLSLSLIAGCLVGSTVASADSTTASTGSATSTSATQQQKIQNIITKGNAEINRRLTTLNSLTSKINSATHLSAADKATLSGEVSSSISGLTSLESQLDSATTIASARTDAQDIYTEYRVYALVAPKVELVKVADDQQVVETNLTTLATKLQSRITAAQQKGENVSALQGDLADLNSKVSASQAISSNIESVVINLQPSDYNSNHSVLEGDNTQLKTAHQDNMAAYQDAKNIVSGLKSLK